MQRVLVLDKNKAPLMPCRPARARMLLNSKMARVYRAKPFTIILEQREGGETQPIEFKIDPGSKTTGVAAVAEFKRGPTVVFGCNLEHRGHKIKQSLEQRRAQRRARRQRKTRYRAPRFGNRTRIEGWLPPSLVSRVHNIVSLTKKMTSFMPVKKLAVEHVRFDTQKLCNPEISGIAYQQGELLGYEVREYLLEKWQRQCAYCDKKNIPLEVEHIIPKSKGGSDSVTNLTLACKPCNQKKNNRSIDEFVQDKERITRILKFTKTPLKDAAAVNATRFSVTKALEVFSLPMILGTGGRTKFNRCSQNYPKDHWIDAACVGETGRFVRISPTFSPLVIRAEGRGSRQQCRVDQYGFPRTCAKAEKRPFGFQTGDIVKASVAKGKKAGTYVGRVAVRTSGFFNIKFGELVIQGIGHRWCRLIQRTDGYSYA